MPKAGTNILLNAVEKVYRSDSKFLSRKVRGSLVKLMANGLLVDEMVKLEDGSELDPLMIH